MTHYHLTASAQGWALTRDPDGVTISAYRNRWEAIDKCKAQLEGEACLLAIHAPDGRVEKVCRFADPEEEVLLS
jgi:hypothetical protein